MTAHRDEALVDYHLAQPDPYEHPTPVTLTGDRSLGTQREMTVGRETHHTKAADPTAPLAPERESDDFATLAAWYSGFAYSEHYRKVTLAQCREIVRAQYAAKGEKVTEARLDDLARTHPLYLDYLARHLTGRTQWEHEYRAAGGMT